MAAAAAALARAAAAEEKTVVAEEIARVEVVVVVQEPKKHPQLKESKRPGPPKAKPRKRKRGKNIEIWFPKTSKSLGVFFWSLEVKTLHVGASTYTHNSERCSAVGRRARAVLSDCMAETRRVDYCDAVVDTAGPLERRSK